MKKIFSFLFLFTISLSVFSQVDTLTPEKKARYRINQIQGKRINLLPDYALGKAFSDIANLAVGRVPFVTMSELRSGKADTARIVQIVNNNHVYNYRYDQSSVAADDSATVIRNGSRRYVIDSPIIIPQIFGAKGDGITDDTRAIDKAIDYLRARGSGELFFPEGTYLVDKIKLKSGVSFRGANKQSTTVKANISTEKNFIYIDEAPVRDISISNLTIMGRGSLNPDQNCLFFEAIEQNIPSYTGGLWYSRFDDLKIGGFEGSGIYLNAQDIRGDLANQFLTFQNIVVFREDKITSRSLKATGQLGQTTFINCEFDGRGKTFAGGLNVEIARTKNSSGVVVNDMSPSCMIFTTCTFQSSESAMLIDRAQNVIIQNCWFENVIKSVTLQFSAIGIVVTGCHFANAAGNNDLSGWGVYVGGASQATITENDFLGLVDYSVKGDNHRGITFSDNYGTIKTTGLTSQVSIGSDNILLAYKFRTVLVNTTTNVLRTITSELGVGESITLRVNGAGTIQIENGGNINVGQGGVMVLKAPDIVTFTRIDLAGTWAVSAVLSQRKDNIISKTAAYVIPASDLRNSGFLTVLADATGGSFTITLPSAVTLDGLRVTVIKTDASANTVTVKGNGTELFGLTNTRILSSQNQSINGVSDGVQFRISAQYDPNVTQVTQVAANADGSSTIVSIPHGLGVIPSHYNAVATSAASQNISYQTADATNVVLHYTTIPTVCTGCMTYNLSVKK